MCTRKHWFFIRYFAEDGECFPMEVKPNNLNISDYDINFDQSANVIRVITNKSLQTEIKFFDMNQETKEGYVDNSKLEIFTHLLPEDLA